MEVEESIDNLLRKLGRRGLANPAARLYAEQVRAKFKNVRYSLGKLEELEQLTVQVDVQDGSTGELRPETQLSVAERVNFYCECFWDFLRSSLDILAQLINEVRSMSLDERSVDFKQVGNKLDDSFLGTYLQRAVENCKNSDEFKTLEEYRHCSMHRRQVFIHTTTIEISHTGTAGYDQRDARVVDKRISYKSFLCSNPWDITPVVDENRPVVTYCERLINKIGRRMVTIINRLA